ncbi:MAG TPA: carbon-nitrogen hydrolase family protein [bacterium]|nr:carbon-nitrogen hydrolase family protein [bacterium]HNS48706.1 carbon-nitrogen hydrolase family protein [bacterium]
MDLKIRVAALNFRPWKWHKDWNAGRLEAFFRLAAGRGARLAVAPEGILEGYLANEAIRWPELRRPMLETAEPPDGPYIRRFQDLARELETCLVFGYAELRNRHDVYNAAIFIDHRGRVCGRHYKTEFQEGIDPAWNFNRPGERLRAFDTPLGRCGIMICYERRNPLVARVLALDGARFFCIPTFGADDPAQDRIVLARARENGLPAIQANVNRNLIISEGEPAALESGADRITLADVLIPERPSKEAARELEKEFFRRRVSRMNENRERRRLSKAAGTAAAYVRPRRPANRKIRIGGPAAPKKS